jgi:hypothetical protein
LKTTTMAAVHLDVVLHSITGTLKQLAQNLTAKAIEVLKRRRKVRFG